MADECADNDERTLAFEMKDGRKVSIRKNGTKVVTGETTELSH